MTLDDIIRNANGGKLASDTDNSNDTQPQEQSNLGLFDKISAFLSNAGQAYASADNPGAEIYSQTPYADNLTNEVHDQNMADGQNIYTVLAPDYTPRPLDDSVYTDIPGTPVDLGTLEDESVRNARMQDSADYMAANWPRLYGAGAGAVENGANVVGGIQNALGLGDSTLQNAEQFEKGMQDYRKQWDATYGDSYFLNPNNFANDAGAVVGSSAPILALSAMTPGALVAGGSRALTGALSRAGLGRLAMSKAGQALIADTVRTLPSSSLADSLSEYGGVVHDLMQNGMSEDEARAQAVPIFYKNMALDTAVLPLELGIAKGGKGLITGLLRRNAGENMGKGIAKGTARTGILSGLSGLTEGYQEGAQNALEDQTKGARDGGWYNPVTWTPEDWKSARAGFVGGALMGIPGNVATAYHPDTKQADLSPEAQTQVQDIKNTLMNDASYGNMDSDTYNSYLELANSGNPELIKLANDSLASWKEKQGISTDSTASTDMTAGEQTGPVNAEMEAEKDRIRQYLNDNTIDQMGGQENYDWLYNTLNSTDPDDVHKAYQTVVDSTAETQAQEAAQTEQQAESQPAGNVSINSDNPFIGYVVKAANDQGIDPKIALSIAARETGGDDVNAINMAPNGGLMQVTEESANDYGVNDLYPDWRDDPEQNAEAGMYILKKKIEEQGGDTWAGVRAYNGAGEAADQYLNQIQQNYDNLGDIGGSSWSDGVSGYDLPTQSDEITAQVETLKPGWKQALPAIGGILNDMGLADGSAISSAGRTSEHNAEVGGAEHSYHINDDERGGGDAVDIVLPEGTTEEQAQAVLDRFKSTGAFKEVLFHDAGSGYHLHLGGYTGGLNGMNGNVDSDMSDIRRQQDAEDRAFDEQEREINDDSRAAMNRIMNDNSVENAFDETQRDTEAAKKQQEETLKTLTSDTQEGQPAQTTEMAQNQPQDVPGTTVDATAPIEQQTTITGANTATKAVQQNQPVQTSQVQPIQTPAGTQDPRINKAIHDPAMLNLVTRAMNGDSAAKESAGKLNQNIVDAVQRHIIATALNAHQQRIAKAPAGKTETILSDDVKTEYPAQYKIVSADDITPSNNTDGSVNAFYPQQYQPRDRTRAGMRKQVEDMPNKLNPSALGASSNANMGAPVINSQGVVLNGNGRTMDLKSVYKGKPKQIKAYKDFLKQNAKSLGIDPATIDSIKNPVLVRQVADDAPVQDIINSKAGGSQMSAGETAKKDADRIKQSTLQLASDSSDLTQESNRKFVNSVLKDVASPEELNTLYTKTGKISQAGITRVKNAVFAKAYGDDFLLTKMSESTDNNIRNVMNSMLAVAPKVAMLNDGMEKGLFYSYPLSDVISGSAKTLISLREQNKPVKFYLEETSLISENENQNSINDVLQFIDRNKRSGKTITAFFNELCNEIELQGHPDQGALIPTENPTMEEVINIAEGKVENNGVQSLFDTGRSEGNQTDQTSGRMADRVLQSPSAGTETNAGINGSERKEESAGKTESRPEVAKGEANEESTESNHVNTEPQQTESKNKESTHAEEGSQGDVQEEVSKFHNVLDDEKSTPKQIIDAYKSVVDKVIANANGSRKNAKIGDKIVTDEYQYLTNSKHWNAFMNENGGRNWHEVATINADAHKTLRAIIKTAGVKTKEAPSSQGIAPYKQAVDDIMDKLAHKKLTPAQAINKLKTIMKDANAARWGEFKAMEAIESKEKLSFDDYKMALDLANDAMKKANDMRLEASRKRKARKTAKELESSTEETKSAEQPKEEAGFTDEEIKTLTDRGFNRWTKKLPNGKVMDRLYIKPEYLGLELTRYKSGNISSAKFNGETISNSEARRIEGTKCYVDVATKEVVCDREDLKQAAQEVIDDALSKEKSQVLAQTETKKAAPKDNVQEEIARGEKAMAIVLQTKQDVKAAMHRDDVGDIDFIYGTPGKGSKFKKGYGIAHIKAKRDSENGSGIDTLNKLVEVIAKGTDTEIQHANGGNGEYRLKIHYDGYTAILSSKTEKANSWLLTGWEDKKEAPVNARSEGYDSSTATTATPTLTRRSRETGASSTPIIPQEATKGNKPDELRNQLSNGGKQAYDYAIDKLSKGNEKVAQSAKENAFIYARMAERWSEIMHEYGNKTYSPEDYTKSHPIVMGQQSGNAQLERAFEQRAWHGSPYDFDSFDLGYIGAGEGDQVHGWGLYFAKDKKISEAYKDIFGYKDIKANVDGKTYHMDEEGDWTVDGNTVEYGTAMGYVLDTISNTGNKEKAIADLESSLNKNKIRGHYADEARKAIDILKNRDVSISKGETLYSVEIPNNAYLLDEDKPIYNQSKTVKRSLLKAVQELPEKQQDRFLEKLVPGLTAKSKATIKAEAQLNTMQSAVNGLKELDEKPLSSLPAFRQRIRKSLFEKIVGSDNVEKVISDTAYRNATIKKLADDVTKQGKIILQLHKKDADRSTARRKELKDNLAQTINTYGLNGKHFYESLSYGLTGDVNKQADASKYLDKYGIKGIKYIGNTDGQCFVIFDDKAVQIIDKYNQDVHNAKAAYDASTGAIRLFDIADQSSFIHESAHMFLSDMERLAQKKDAPAVLVSDLQTVKDWAGYKPGQMNGHKGTALEKEFQEYADAIREAKKTGDVVAIKSAEARWIHERFARGFERYIADGKAPNESLKNVFEKFKDWMVSIYHDLKNLGKKPPKEIQDVMARMITPEVDTKYSVREAHEQLTRSKEDLKAKIKEAFPNAKEIKDEGDRVTFTMPNGSHIVVDMKNEIVLTDKELAQAKKDHHIDDNGNVVVEGYAEARGKDAYIALAQGSREGVGFHEAYHIAEDAVLTDRENAAIKKAIPDAEERADKYAEWVEARKHGRGTAWGKLFQKIKDFAMKMKTILTGAENVHNVFRKIESGEVWERTPTNGQSGKYSLNRKKLHDAIRRWNNLCDYYEKSDKQLWKKKHNGDLYKLMDMPLILEAISNQNMELSVYGSFFGHALKKEHHGMTLDIIRQLPAAMAEPTMILQSRNGKNKFVFVLDVKDSDGATVIVPVELEKIDKKHGIINIANSAYGKTRRDGVTPNDEWFIKNIDEGNLLYVDTKKSVAHWPSGASSPVGSAVIHALSKSIIKTEKDLVNLQNQFPTRYSVTKPKDAAEEAREKAEQDAEDTTVTLNDILTEARKIVPIYTKSKVGEKSPAKYHYDARQRAGFVPGSFDVGDIGSAIALHIDSIGEIKGANIELTKDIIEDRQMEQRNAKKYKSKVPPDISPSQARQEGVRNFGRLYFLDNERAKETYPQYYDLFEKALDGMPKEKAGVEKVLALQDQRVRQNPLLSAAAGISNGKPDSQLTWKERMKKRLLHLYAQMVDETDPIGQLTKALELETGEKIADEKDPHKRALMCNSAASARAFMLLDGDNRIANLKALNKTYKGAIKNKVVFADIIDKLGKVTKDELKKAEVKDAETLLSMYLIAARTEEIVENNKDYIRPDGYGHETCMRILVNAPQAIKDAATLFWKYNENLVNIIEQQGLITHAAAEGMRKYKKYCPMYRDFNEGDSVDTHISTINTGRGFINQTSGIKSLSGGSSRPVINPIDSMINMTTVLIGKCERNNVAKIMVQCAEDHGGLGGVIVRDPTLTGADRQRCAFTVLVAGKKVVYRTTPELYESITQMDTNSAAFMSNLFGKFTDALRFGATNTPSFMMRNFIRDTVTASINSKYGFKPLVDSFRGMWKLTHDKQFKADFYAQGVPMDTYIRNDIRGAQDFKKKLRKNLKKYPFGIRQAMWFMSATARKYNNVGELIEQGTRAGEFLKARKKGATEEEAGYAAREVSINFSRHGSVGKKFNRYIPFFNASIQGIDKFIRTFKEDPKRAIWATIKYIILPSLACWAFNHDDDWYKDLDPTTKYLNWCIHIPGTDTHFLIPKPQEVGVMFGSGIEAVLNQFLADDPKAMKQWAWELAGVMTPGLAVTMIRPFFEWQRNYSLWTNHNLVPKRLEKLPSEQQYTNSTSELAKLLGDTWIAKNISVGDRHGISPIAIDNFFSAWFGSMGRTLAKTLDKPIESLRGKDRPTEPAKYWYESPVIGSFVSNDDSQRSAYVDRLYDLSDQMETDYKRSDSYAVQKGKKGAKVPTELAQVRTAMKTVSKLNKEIRDIQDNPKMSAEEKRTQIDTRKVKMRGIAKKAVLKLGD